MTAIAFWQTHLDCRLVLTAAFAAGTSTFTAPCPSFANVAVFLNTGVAYTLTHASDTTMTVAGVDLSGGQSIVGVYAPMSLDLSEVIARDQQDKPIIDLGVLLTNMTLLHNKAGAFSVQIAHVNPTIYPTATRAWAPDLTVAPDRTLNRLRLRIGMVAEETTISIINAAWQPMKIAGIGYETEVMEMNR